MGDKPNNKMLMPNANDPILMIFMSINIFGLALLLYFIPRDIMQHIWSYKIVEYVGNIIPQVDHMLSFYIKGQALGELVFVCAIWWAINMTITPLVAFISRKRKIFCLDDNPEFKYLYIKHRIGVYLFGTAWILFVLLYGTWAGSGESLPLSRIYHDMLTIGFFCILISLLVFILCWQLLYDVCRRK